METKITFYTQSRWRFFHPGFYLLHILKNFPPAKMAKSLRFEFIFNHPYLVEMSFVPHSHLWGQINYASVLLNIEEKKAYIRSSMTWYHWVHFYYYREDVRFHAHGVEGEVVEDQITLIHRQDILYRMKLGIQIMLSSFALIAAGVYLIIEYSSTL